MLRSQKTPHRNAGEETALAAAWRASAPGLAAVVIFGAAVNLLKFAMPLYLLQVLDRIPASRSVETLALLTLMALAALAAGAALDIVRRRMLTHWGYWIERRFGPELVARGLGGGASAGRPDLDTALSDLARIRAFVTRSLAAWLDTAWVPVFLIGVALVHPWLGGWRSPPASRLSPSPSCRMRCRSSRAAPPARPGAMPRRCSPSPTATARASVRWACRARSQKGGAAPQRDVWQSASGSTATARCSAG
ncbi:MAG: ABC-type protease/lipase transport system [Rhodobacteraceae bacterium HLUCCA09]|nr:MAG: ABC-type protease/lipase transport system [Rhodobacteraceae bacterium HLUCCA09]